MIDKTKFNDPKEQRKFGIALAVFLLLIATYLYFRHEVLNPVLPAVSGVILITGLIWPRGIKPLFVAFSYFGFGMNWIVTNVILLLLFFVIFTPTGMIMRLFGKKLLDNGFKEPDATYWIDRPADQQRDGNYEKQF